MLKSKGVLHNWAVERKDQKSLNSRRASFKGLYSWTWWKCRENIPVIDKTPFRAFGRGCRGLPWERSIWIILCVDPVSKDLTQLTNRSRLIWRSGRPANSKLIAHETQNSRHENGWYLSILPVSQLEEVLVKYFHYRLLESVSGTTPAPMEPNLPPNGAFDSPKATQRLSSPSVAPAPVSLEMPWRPFLGKSWITRWVTRLPDAKWGWWCLKATASFNNFVEKMETMDLLYSLQTLNFSARWLTMAHGQLLFFRLIWILFPHYL